MPEIWLVLAMCAVVLVPFVRRRSAALPVGAALAGLALALFSALPLSSLTGGAGTFVFHRMLAIDPFAQFFKVLLLAFTVLVVAQWSLTSRAGTDVKDVPDYLCLLLGAAFGMALMASASNLLMIFVATEAASLPSFALAGFRKRHRPGTESSLKYVLFGAVASSVSLYGMSLIYGAAGTLDLAGIAGAAAAGDGMTPMLAVGLMAMFAGFAFKLSAVPLHFWCPDVFEGAPIEITTFLSVASKGAAVCLLLRVMHAFGVHGAAVGGPGFAGLATGVALLGAVTATWGNLVALRQVRIRRLLAYSSIAHAGYMIMGTSLVCLLPEGAPVQKMAGAVLFYLLVYMFMNLGAFTVAAVIAQRSGSEDIRDYAGLIRRAPITAVLLATFLLSLFGMPGLGGFMAKVLLAIAMFEVGGVAAFLLVGVLLLNTLLSLYYYVRPVYYMVFVSDEQDRPAIVPRGAALAMLLACAAALLWTGLLPNGPGQLARDYGTLVARPERVPAVATLIEPPPPAHRTSAQ